MTAEQQAALPQYTTECPFLIPESSTSQKEPKTDSNLQIHDAYGAFGSLSGDQAHDFGYGGNFRFANDSKPSRHNKRGNKRRRQNSAPKTIENCWFCIDSDVAEHLITSVGDECYLALPKGGLVSDHILIIPLDHVTSPFAIQKETFDEIEKYKSALSKYAQEKKEHFVFFERNVKTQYGMVHYLIQCVPIPNSISSKKVQQIFEEYSNEQYNVNFQVLSNPEENIFDVVPKHAQYFLAELPDRTRLLHIVPENSRHPLQLGRFVSDTYS